jgi:hypothetical protein
MSKNKHGAAWPFLNPVMVTNRWLAVTNRVTYVKKRDRF